MRNTPCGRCEMHRGNVPDPLPSVDCTVHQQWLQLSGYTARLASGCKLHGDSEVRRWSVLSYQPCARRPLESYSSGCTMHSNGEVHVQGDCTEPASLLWLGSSRDTPPHTTTLHTTRRTTAGCIQRAWCRCMAHARCTHIYTAAAPQAAL